MPTKVHLTRFWLGTGPVPGRAPDGWSSLALLAYSVFERVAKSA